MGWSKGQGLFCFPPAAASIHSAPVLLQKGETCGMSKSEEKKHFEELNEAMVRRFPVPVCTWLKGNLGNLSPLNIVVCSIAVPLNTSSTLNND